jgi:glycosyltransferase involved in cell wall biosynthesis
MLHLVHILEATTGGTRRHLRDLALGLDPAEFRMDAIVSLRRDPDFGRDLALFRERGIGVHVVPMRRRIAPLADLVALVRLVRLLRRLRPDVVHTHCSKAGFLGRLAARLAGVRATVHTSHVFAFEDAATPGRGRCYRAMERLAVRWTTRLIAVSEHECELALGLGFAEANVVGIANGIGGDNVQRSTFNAQRPTEERERPMGNQEPRTKNQERFPEPRTLNPEPLLVTFLGRLCRQKAPDLFLAAIPDILRQAPEARFRIVGEGTWRDWAMRQVARQAWHERVTFGVAHAEAEVAAELAAATVLVMPSRWEGLPYTLLEALHAGTPVVAAAVGGVLDVAADTDCAVLVPPNHPGSLAVAVVGLLRSRETRGRLAAAGHVRVQAFGLQCMIDRTAAVYREVAGGAGRIAPRGGAPTF